MTPEISSPPPVSWAQNKTCIFLTFNVECEKPEISVENKKVHFKGICEPDKKLLEVEIPLFSEIDPDKSIQRNKGRVIELILAKIQSDAGFWSSLTSDKKKRNWLKIDFNRWQAEDDSEEEGYDMNEMFSSKMGGFGDDFEDADDGETDENSSDEEKTIPNNNKTDNN